MSRKLDRDAYIDALVTSITGCGYVHVHTWRESHGEEVTEIYQSRDGHGFIEIATYRTARSFGDFAVRAISNHQGKDYLGAKEVRDNLAAHPEGVADWEVIGARNVSPCFTAGHENYRNVYTGKYCRLVAVAGHGEWKIDITEKDLAP